MNVVIYARFSSHKQTEQSIEGQLSVCKEYAKNNGYTVVGEYIDRAVTGTSDNRPQFLKMIEDSANGTFNGVLVYQLDRFARDRYDSANYKRKLKNNGVKVLSAREHISDDASGILVESVLEGMAEYFSVELGQKVKRGMQINADKCYYNGGTIPIGLKAVEVERIARTGQKPIIKRKFAIDEETAPIVRKVFNMYISGDTMADIVRYLNNQQIKTSRGNEFNKNSIHRILLDKKYAGIYSYNGVDIPNGIPQLIDTNTFERVKEIMFRNKKAPARARAKTEYLLTTKLFCGHCKDMMVGVSGTSKSGKLHNYYQCKKQKLKLCDKKTVTKDYIEDIVVNEARNQLTDENIDIIAKEIVKVCENEKDSSNLKRLEKTLNENLKKKDNLIIAVSECDIESVRKSLYQELSKIEDKVKTIEKQISIEEAQYVNLEYDEIRFFFEQLKNGDINDKKYRKILITTLINRVYLYDTKAMLIFNTQNKSIEIEISLVNDIECSLMVANSSPKRKKRVH